MVFNEYLKSRTADIRVNNIFKAKDINVIRLDGECNFEASSIERIDNSLKVVNAYNLFRRFYKLGERLYKHNNDKIIKFKKTDPNYEEFELSFETFLITSHDYDDYTISEVKKWLENENYCLEEDRDLIDSHFIETDCLIDLSIFNYLIICAVDNKYKNPNSNISFNTFIKVEGINNDNIDTKQYLRIINFIMKQFETMKYKYIKEESELVYNEKFDQLRLVRVYDNMYSFLWYILKLYLSYISINDTGDVFSKVCSCGNEIIGRDKRCDHCKLEHNTNRRRLNRENKKNIERINILLDENKFPDSIEQKAKALLSNKPNRYENNSQIKLILSEMENYLNSQ